MNNPSFSEIKRYLMEENDWTVLEADDFLLDSAKHFEADGKASLLSRDEWTILAMEWMEVRVANEEFDAESEADFIRRYGPNIL